MIYYPLKTLINAGIKDILIVSGKGHVGHFLELLGSGSDIGVKLSYEIQKEAGGIAHALGLAEQFADGDSITVILGDNIFENNVKEDVDSFISGARIFLKKVPDPHRFGVADVDERYHRVRGIEEKPLMPKSDYAVAGLYIYDSSVFNVIKTLKPSGRGELEITDVNNHYIASDSMSYAVLGGYWSDAGTFESLLLASQLVKRKKTGKDVMRAPPPLIMTPGR
jgi:glucose-1-phosphate thymidylyltransferase